PPDRETLLPARRPAALLPCLHREAPGNRLRESHSIGLSRYRNRVLYRQRTILFVLPSPNPHFEVRPGPGPRGKAPQPVLPAGCFNRGKTPKRTSRSPAACPVGRVDGLAADDRALHLKLRDPFRLDRQRIAIEHDEIGDLARLDGAAFLLIEGEPRRLERVHRD